MNFIFRTPHQGGWAARRTVGVAPEGVRHCLLRTGRNGHLISGFVSRAPIVGMCTAAKAFSLDFSTSRIRECATGRTKNGN